MLDFDRAAVRSPALWLIASLLLPSVCGCRSEPSSIGDDDAHGFVSDVASVPIRSTCASRKGGGAAPALAEASLEDEGSDAAGRAIAEADIVQIQGDRLFALAPYSGLTVVDIADPAELRVLGRYTTSATPFEMHLRGELVYIMLNEVWTYQYHEEVGSEQWGSAARMLALDASDPAEIRVVGDHEIPGEVAESRLVGDVLYLVTFESGHCWGCAGQVRSRVASFDVSDPAELPRIAELSFDSDQDGALGPPSVSLSPERMYIARGSSNEQNIGSTIHVVDVSDPSGALALDAELTVAGSIDSHWQMDEYDGVLRVISQGRAWESHTPVLETFQIERPAEPMRLGSLELRLTPSEWLQSVRFDGTRAYATAVEAITSDVNTFEQMNPLFTFDLSDPAMPLQMGELSIPRDGYHMEPHGERLYGLGFDRENKDGFIQVSIFDVSNLAAPTMLDRVNFGGPWSLASESPDRVQKTFNLLLERGLILVPFAGGDYDDLLCYQYLSGIQIIDVQADDLTLRGMAPQLGNARRVLLHQSTLFGISEESVQTFDVANRDAPKVLDRLEVARDIDSIHPLGDRTLRFGNDWWTNRTVVDCTDKADANAIEPEGELALDEVASDDSGSCASDAEWGTVLVHGDTAYVARHSVASGILGIEERMAIYVLDVGSASPRVVTSVNVPPASGDQWLGSLFLTDGALLVARGVDSHDGDQRPRFQYDIFSLEDPRAPRYADRLEVPGQNAGSAVTGCGNSMGSSWWYGLSQTPTTLVDGDLLISQHEEPQGDDTGRVRYYLDRLDVSDPDHARMLEPVNIPGELVHFDADAGVIVTVEDELRQTVMTTSSEDCYWRGSVTIFDRTGAGVCRVYDRLLNTLKLTGDVATLVGRITLDEQRYSLTWVASNTRVFVLSKDRATSAPSGRSDSQLALFRIASFAVGEDASLHALGETTLRDNRDEWNALQLMARGERAFVQDHNQIHVVNAAGAGEPVLVTHDMPGWSCNSLQVDDANLWCAMGKRGVLRFDL